MKQQTFKDFDYVLELLEQYNRVDKKNAWLAKDGDLWIIRWIE